IFTNPQIRFEIFQTRTIAAGTILRFCYYTLFRCRYQPFRARHFPFSRGTGEGFDGHPKSAEGTTDLPFGAVCDKNPTGTYLPGYDAEDLFRPHIGLFVRRKSVVIHHVIHWTRRVKVADGGLYLEQGYTDILAMRLIPACLVKCDEFRLGVQRRAVIEQPPCIFFEGKRFQGRVVYRAILISGIAPGQQRIQPCTKAHLEDVYWTTGCRNLRETMLNENMLRFSERSVARVIGLI